MKVLFAVCIFTSFLASGHAARYWTGWLDRDNPSGTGDWETYSSFAKPPCASGYKPVDAKCRVTGIHWEWYEANQVMRTCYECTAKGLVCVNAEQPNGQKCKDYEIAFLCHK